MSFTLKSFKMSYTLALEKAGCKILAFKFFGSYQGTWAAFVEYQGEKGIVTGAFGSCTHCDAFEAEFYEDNGPMQSGDTYYSDYSDAEEITKEEFEKIQDVRLAKFGMNYLAGGLYTKEHFQNRLSNLDSEDWFDMESKEELQWILDQNW